MLKLDQRGAIQFIVLLILLGGIIAGVWLVTAGPLKLFPKATVSGPVSPQTSFSLLTQLESYKVGDIIEVKLVVRSDIDAANLFAAKINYDPQFLQLGRVDVTSFVTNWVEQYWGDPGKISLVGGVPAPGVQTQTNSAPLKMASLYFTALKVGSTTVSFDDASAIYKNADNLNILGVKNNATVVILSVAVTSPSPIPTTSPTPAPPVLASSSYRRVFITSTTYRGDGFGELSGADVQCQTRANTANLGGTWKAWISDSNTSASSRLEHSTVPYKLLNDTVVASSWSDLTTAKPDGSYIKHAINITELGKEYNPLVWTNTQPNGGIVTTSTINNCINWTQSYSGLTAYVGAPGINDFLGQKWTSYVSQECSKQAALYCFEQAAAPIATPIPGTGDGNRDGKINLADMSVLLTDFNKESGFRVNIDMNGDGKINTFDFGLMRNLLIQKGVIKG